jgi:chromosome segregation ATPase
MARNLLASADTLLGLALSTWDSTLGDPEVQERIELSWEGAQHSARSAKQSLAAYRDSLALAQSSVQRLLREAETLGEGIGPGLDSTLTGLKARGEEAKRLKDKAGKLAARVSELGQRVSAQQGSLGALAQDSALHAELEQTSSALQALWSEIRRQGLDLNVDIF